MHKRSLGTISVSLVCGAIAVLCQAASNHPTGQLTDAPAGWTLWQDGDNQILTPTGASDAGVTATIGPEEAAGNATLEDWLAARVKADGPIDGRLTEAGKVQRMNPSVVDVANVYQTSAGRYLVLYCGLDKPEGRRQFVKVRCPAQRNLIERYMRQSAPIVASLMKTPGSAAAPAPSNPPDANPEKQVVAAGSGSDAYQARITGIYLHLEYTFGVGGMALPTYRPHILLPDGTITDDLAYYPQSEGDIAAWRAHKPDAWGTWQKNGSKIDIRWKSPRRKPETWDKWFVARPGKPRMVLSGLYQSLGGGGNTALGGNVIIAAWSDFRFSPDGTVTSGRGSGSYTGGPGASVATSSSRRPQQARYEIRDHSIRLTYPDGRQETQWFFLYPDSDDVIGVGASTYSRRK